MQNKTLSLILPSVLVLLLLGGCSPSSPSTAPSIQLTSQDIDVADSWIPSEDTKMRKLVFNMPEMDRKMCETFPRIIINALESTPGVIDARFDYEGHVVTVYYDPVVVKREQLIEHKSFVWVGTVFVSEDKSVLDPLRLFDEREGNNDLVMPGDHMADLDISDKGYSDLSAQEFNQLIQDSGVFLVDVHIPEQRHIPGTDVLIPFNAITENIDKLPSDKSAPIAVYCRSGSMSKEASEELAALGYTNVSNLIGGLNEWKIDSLPVE